MRHCPICNEEVKGLVGRAAHMRLSHPKAEKVRFSAVGMSDDEKREAILKQLQFHCGGTIPSWWRNFDGAVDVYDLYGEDQIICLARELLIEDHGRRRSGRIDACPTT